jgi:gliding motility-associated-like protein
VKKLLFSSAFLMALCLNIFSQGKLSQLGIPPFNEDSCKIQALKEGIGAGELPGYVKYKRAMYYSQNNNLYYSPVKNAMPKLSNSSSCYNMNFENQNFDSWLADTGKINNLNNGTTAVYQSGFSTVGINASEENPLARQTIVTTKAAMTTLPVLAPYTGYDARLTNMGFIDKTMPIDSDVTLLPPGAIAAVRLGNALAGAQTERLKKTFIVDANSQAFTYSYAAILEDPLPTADPHTPAQRPRFTIRILDQNDSLMPGLCSFYEVYSGKDSSYISLDDTTCSNAFLYPGTCGKTILNYKKWTVVGMDLSAYMGKKVTVEFTTRDCSRGGHFGYAYLSTMCSTFDIKSTFCPGQDNIKLEAPSGYLNYVWKDPNGNIIGTQQEITILNPKLDDVYSVQLTAVTGCTSLLNSKIVLNPPDDLPDYLLKQNVFTPNGDHVNDVFKTDKFIFVNAFNIEIYDRWGLKIFESTNPEHEWNGQVNGTNVPEGVYFWIAKYQSTCDLEHKDIVSKGFVQLLR